MVKRRFAANKELSNEGPVFEAECAARFVALYSLCTYHMGIHVYGAAPGASF